jgi:hypothetical protein
MKKHLAELIAVLFIANCSVAQNEIATFKIWNEKNVKSSIKISFPDSASESDFKKIFGEKQTVDTTTLIITKANDDIFYDLKTEFPINLEMPRYRFMTNKICRIEGNDSLECNEADQSLIPTGRKKKIKSYECFEYSNKERTVLAYVAKGLPNYIAPLTLVLNGAILEYHDLVTGKSASIRSIR